MYNEDNDDEEEDEDDDDDDDDDDDLFNVQWIWIVWHQPTQRII